MQYIIYIKKVRFGTSLMHLMHWNDVIGSSKIVYIYKGQHQFFHLPADVAQGQKYYPPIFGRVFSLVLWINKHSRFDFFTCILSWIFNIKYDGAVICFLTMALKSYNINSKYNMFLYNVNEQHLMLIVI